MKKVLFVIDSLGCGGAEKSLVSLLPLLDYSKMHVDLLITSHGGIFEQYVNSEVRIISMPKVQGMRKLWFLACQLCFSLSLRLFSRRHGAELRWTTMHTAFPKMDEEYDVAVAYQQGFPTYYVAKKVKARKKLAWINADIAKAGYRTEFNRRFYNHMTRVIAVSNALERILRASSFIDSQLLFTVYDVINVELILKMSKEYAPFQPTNDDTLCIVTTGRLSKPKNYLLAVETARLLKAKGLDFHWYFIGEGPERPAIESLVTRYALQDNVHLLGMKTNPYPYMAGCDIYVQTSSFEGFCLTLCEARILRRPVVSTNFSVVYNQIQNGVNGLIAEMNADSLAEKILLLAHNPKIRKRLAESVSKEKNCTAETESSKVNALLTE